MTQEQNPRPVKRYARLAPLYKALIWTSFVINTVLIIVVAVLGWTLYTARNQILDLTSTTRAFAGTNIAELQDVVAKLQGSTIKYTVQLRGARLPIELEVPVQQETNVVLREPVPLSVPAAILFPGGGGNLNANVNLELPAGLQLPIRLDFLLPLKQSIPVDLDVPVNIPLRETELGPQFQRLGAVVERLVAPAEPLLTRPDKIPYSSTPLLAPSATAAPLVVEPLPTAGPEQPAP